MIDYDKPWYLYELLDEAGVRIYAGITSDPERRYRQHVEKTPGYGCVDHPGPFTIRVVYQGTRNGVRRMEAALLKEGLPGRAKRHTPRTRGERKPDTDDMREVHPYCPPVWEGLPPDFYA